MIRKNYYIIGVSAAGLGAAIKLRELEPESSITCITYEIEPPYNRCLLADLLAKVIPENRVYTRGIEFFEQSNIDLLTGVRVTHIDRKEKTLTLDDGDTLFYDAVLIATGRSVKLPALPGINISGVFPFYNLNDTHSIRSFINEHAVKTAVVVGGGVSGVEVADALAKQKIAVHLIERANHILPRQVDDQGAATLSAMAQQQGVTMHMKQSIKSIHGSPRVTHVELLDGTVLQADIIIFAIGGMANIDFVAKSGLNMHNQTLLVDQFGKTNDPLIFAAGDVCSVKDLLTGNLVQTCLWTDAALQGMSAASSMANHQRPYPGILVVTSSHIFGTTFVTAGPVSDSECSYKSIVVQGDGFYHRLLVDQENMLKGFCMIGNVHNIGLLRKALLTKTPIDQLLPPDMLMHFGMPENPSMPAE